MRNTEEEILKWVQVSEQLEFELARLEREIDQTAASIDGLLKRIETEPDGMTDDHREEILRLEEARFGLLGRCIQVRKERNSARASANHLREYH